MSLAGERKLGRGAGGLLVLGAALAMLLGAAAPVQAQQNTSAPTIQGSDPRQEGQTLTATPGEWSQSTTSVTRQWLRCDGAGANCEGIEHANGLSYTLEPGDVGKRIRIRETGCAVLPIFCNTATSEPTGVVLPDPSNTSPPTIGGTAREDETLSVTSNGGWLTASPPLSFSYQWRRCDAAGGGCANIGGATGSSYRMTAADIGRTIRVAVTATNARGRSSTAESAQSGAVQPGPPVAPANVVAPLIGGTLVEGELIATTNGTWSGRPAPTFSYQWQRCRPDCVDLPGQTSQAYRLTSADVGARMRAVVTANNSAGSASAPSAQSGPIAARSSLPGSPGGAAPGSPAPDATASLLTPFPVVVIAGRLLRSGARITLLGVRAPRGSDVTVRCRGRSCPARRVATRVGRRGRLRVRRFQRLLRTGIVIEVFVTKPNRIGKYTRFRIRSRRRPARRDLCVFPGSRRPSRCPSS